MARDWLNLGSDKAYAESIITEAMRRIKLEAKNDPAFVPPADTLSTVLAARSLVMQPPLPTPTPDTLGIVMAARVFLRGAVGGGSTGGAVLTIGANLTGGAYDGSSPVTIALSTTPSVQKLSISKAAGTNRDVEWQSSGVARWQWDVDGTAESGGNAGSNIALIAYTDAGAVIDSPISIIRAAGGVMAFNRAISVLSLAGGAAPSFASTGANATAGQATLVAGTVTVNTTAANTFGNGVIILLTRVSRIGTVGVEAYSVVPGTSFTITSSSATDTSIFNWVILKVH